MENGKILEVIESDHGAWRYPENRVSGASLASLKHEEVYRHAYETVTEARKGITDYYAISTRNALTKGLTTELPTTLFYKRKPLSIAA